MEDLCRDQLIALLEQRDNELVHLDDKVGYLRAQLAMYRRIQLGQKRERFEGDVSQMALPFEAVAEQAEK